MTHKLHVENVGCSSEELCNLHFFTIQAAYFSICKLKDDIFRWHPICLILATQEESLNKYNNLSTIKFQLQNILAINNPILHLANYDNLKQQLAKSLLTNNVFIFFVLLAFLNRAKAISDNRCVLYADLSGGETKSQLICKIEFGSQLVLSPVYLLTCLLCHAATFAI